MKMPNADANAAAVVPKDDIVTTRARWHSRPVFVVAAVGYAIGLGNIWKFPYLTFKHGGITFVLAYLWALLIVGMPMLLLELTLGQKMQRGSVGSLRGITPRLAGVGWAASFSGFITCLVYNVLLGMSLVYLVQSGGDAQPWTEKNLERPLACQTAALMGTPAAEIYLFLNVTSLYGEASCTTFEEGDGGRFSTGLFIANLVCWVVIFASVVVGPKLIQLNALVSVPLRFLFLIILVFHYTGLNSEEGGTGIGWYLGGEPFPLPPDGTGITKYMSFEGANDSLFQDAYAQVFYSVGVCVGAMFAYGSYNKTKKPVIVDALLICLIDLCFAVIAGFAVWGAIGYLQAKGDVAYYQKNAVGLMFVAMPVAATVSGSTGMFGLFCFTLWLAGIDTSVGYCESLVANICDQTYMARWKAAVLVCTSGMLLSMLFTSNWGWVLFDMVDHYISNYVIIAIGMCQCISVGWLFERESTASRSEHHRKSLRSLALFYWFPVVTINFYATFGFPELQAYGILVIIVTTLMALAISKWQSNMAFISWYHEIAMCGTDKIAMSLTILSNPDGRRTFWMLPFEAYFGLLIKFVNPCCLMFLFCESLARDLAEPYGLT